jgi:hypothetical protein
MGNGKLNKPINVGSSDGWQWYHVISFLPPPVMSTHVTLLQIQANVTQNTPMWHPHPYIHSHVHTHSHTHMYTHTHPSTVGLLCDLLWSDPDKEVMGWGENDRGVSFTFGPEIVSKFLAKHDMDLICRAHQVCTQVRPIKNSMCECG